MASDMINAVIFPSADTVYRQGEGSIQLIPVQSIINVLTHVYPNIGSLDATGINDERTTETVKNLQRIFGQAETGEIDVSFWDNLAALYSCTLPRGRFRPDESF